jgi:hypothetical protein
MTPAEMKDVRRGAALAALFCAAPILSRAALLNPDIAISRPQRLRSPCQGPLCFSGRRFDWIGADVALRHLAKEYAGNRHHGIAILIVSRIGFATALILDPELEALFRGRHAHQASHSRNDFDLLLSDIFAFGVHEPVFPAWRVKMRSIDSQKAAGESNRVAARVVAGERKAAVRASGNGQSASPFFRPRRKKPA